MTRVNFYIIETGTDEAIDTFICRLTEKAWSQDNTVYLHVQNEQHAMKFDDLLWSFNDESFVPHQIPVNSNNAQPEKSVVINHVSDCQIPTTHHDVLINLNHETPSFFSQFDRVAEIITMDETSKEKGRQRYQFYRDRGYALETHKMSL